MKLRPESALLLCLARLRLQPAERDSALELLRQGIDWADFTSLAERHGVSPLAERHLASLRSAKVPKSVVASLWARNTVTQRRNRLMASELANVHAALEREAIETIPYKGPTLALYVYGDLALREFGDLDLLVRSRDVPRAKAILASLGYEAVNPLPPALEARLLRTWHLYELPLVDKPRGLMVELHWRPDPEFEAVALADDGWWRRLATLPFEGSVVRTLAPHELLLVLCLHGTKHFWTSLGWLVDVAELIRAHPEMDWPWIMATAQRLGCRRRLALGLALAQELLQAPLPDDVRDLVADASVVAMAHRLQHGFFAPDFDAYSVPEALRMNLRLADELMAGLRQVARALLTPGWGEWRAWHLPPALFFLYYPLRFARLFRKYLWRWPQATPRRPRSRSAATPHTPPPQPHSTG